MRGVGCLFVYVGKVGMGRTPFRGGWKLKLKLKLKLKMIASANEASSLAALKPIARRDRVT